MANEAEKYVVLPDGGFGSASGASILVQVGETSEEAHRELESGRIGTLYSDIDEGRTEGNVIPVDGLLALWEIVGNLAPGHLNDKQKMIEFFDAVSNLDIW